MNKSIVYRVLIIEDDLGWCELMQEFLMHYAKKYEVSLEIELADNCEAACQLMASKLFQGIAIDLRLPEKKGSPLTKEAKGLDLVMAKTQIMPMGWGHIYTAFAEEHALDTYRKLSGGDISPLPMWEKASRDNAGDDRYTQKEWAQRIITVLLPRDKALAIPLVNERPQLKERLQKLSPLGEALGFTINAGRKHLPPGLAHSCAVIYRWLGTGEAQHELTAFNEVLFLAETVQHWLWVQAAAWLRALGFELLIVWPMRDKNSGRATRAGVEEALGLMLEAIGQCSKAPLAATWLAYLHVRKDAQYMNIIDALAYIRGLRNKQHHQNNQDDLPWEQLALPLRVVMDAAAFLAAYPVVRRPVPAPDSRWRFTLLKGEADPLPEDDWSLAGGVLGETGHFFPVRDDNQLYQLWPCADGSLGLLKLWPFVEQRTVLGEGRKLWLLYGLDARNNKRAWERSALDGQDFLNSDVANERLGLIQKLAKT